MITYGDSSLVFTEIWAIVICFVAPLLVLWVLRDHPAVATSGGRYPPGVFDGFKIWHFLLALTSVLSVGWVASIGYMPDTYQGNQIVKTLAWMGIFTLPIATFVTYFWRRYDSLAPWRKVVVWASFLPALGLLLLIVIALIIALAIFGMLGSSTAFGGRGSGGGVVRTAMGSDGRLYEKTGLAGGWRPKTSLLGGHQQDVDIWGNPQAKTGMFGGPVEARGPLGTQERGPDGGKLYERK